MNSSSPRKLTRFYIINPVGDRRLEPRFESKESVVLRVTQTGKIGPAIAYDIGQRGLRMECNWQIQSGMEMEIAFPNTSDQMRCFGHVIWVRERGFGKYYECGVAIEVWHGIVSGENSWKTVRGVTLKPERRKKIR